MLTFWLDLINLKTRQRFPMAQKISVLMVDDEERFRETTARMLVNRGFETTIAGSGEEALDILSKAPKDVVILDIKMPGMDGHQTLARIKAVPPAPKSSCSPDMALPLQPRRRWRTRLLIISASPVTLICLQPKFMMPIDPPMQAAPAARKKCATS